MHRHFNEYRSIENIVRAAYQYNILLKSARFPQGREENRAPHGSQHISRPVLRTEDVRSPLNIIISGGGTGGHLFPGIAIAESFTEKNDANRILFVLTGNPFEKRVLSETRYDFATISASGIKGKTLWEKIKSVLLMPSGIFEAIKIIRRFQPDLAVGMGGYSSGPVIIAAWLMGIKIVLHEQNIKPGITNRFLSNLANRVYVSFKSTSTGMFKSNIHVTGNPVRKTLLQYTKIQSDTRDNLVEEKFTVLVLGGSQGAHSINMAVVDSLACLSNPETFRFIHQTGSQDEHLVRDTYMRLGIDCEVKPFFDDMGPVYGKADLLICRAGATTVAEVTALGKCSIFIPYPYAADDHQTSNAKSLADAGAAEILPEHDLTGERLAERIEALASDPIRLGTLSVNSKRMGSPGAAEHIINDCYQLLHGSKKIKEGLY